MAHPKIEHEELVEKLFEVFRTSGYDGASIMQLAAATGLKKASLYHRFPRGKEEMAEIVLDYADRWMEEHVIRILEADTAPLARLKEALEQVNNFYGKGEKACLLRSLSLGTGAGLFQSGVQRSFARLQEGFQAVGADLGLSPGEAKRMAENIIIRIQGSLLLTSATKDSSIFERTLMEINREALTLQQSQK
jgi:AcrR family transcriptional regulator